MRSHALIAALLFCGAVSAAPQDPRDSFEDFRRSVLQEHADFRRSVLDDYAKFFEGIWEEHSSYRGLRRDENPKPTVAPVAPATPAPRPATLPKPAPERQPAPQPAPAAPTAKPVAGGRTAPFDFYGITLNIADCRPALRPRLNGGADFAAQWRTLLKDSEASRLAASLAATAEELALNDYLTFDLVSKYVGERYAGSHSSARAALAHYLLATMGYGVRVALSGGEGLLLVPVAQTVYGRPYMTIGGEKFYVFADSGSVGSGSPISTCKLPEGAETGRRIDMRFNRPLNLPRKPRPFELEHGGIRLSGELNENLYPMLYRYPQTDMAAYAESNVDPELRSRLVSQLKEQLAARGRLEAVNALLSFTQSAIDYASDEVSHRFEKPYFLEEWLYYPVNDCEDRAIFYSYMLWNVLGVENQMLTFPGHESVAVALDEPISGDSYEYGGRTFYISDPTYIGATTGMCMPDCQNVTPEIEYHYKK